MDDMLATAAFANYGGSAVLVSTSWRRVVLRSGAWFERLRVVVCDARHCVPVTPVTALGGVVCSSGCVA